MWSFYVPSMVLVILACFTMLRRYAAPTVNWFCKVLVMVGWLTSISIVALVPIDVWSTLKLTQNKSINIMWSISYWSTQLLTWVLIPLSQGYFDAGDFTFLGRLRQSIKDRIIYFSAMGVAAFFIVGILLLMGELSIKELLPWAMVLANTYGLVAGILLLGYGLVAIPRQMWQQSDPEASHKWALYRIGQAAEKLEDAALEMQRVATVVEATSKSMSARDALRPYMDLIYHQAQREAPINPSQAIRDQRGHVNLDKLSERDLDYGAERRGLAMLRRRLTRVISKFNGLRSKYVLAVADGTSLEAICKCRRTKDFVPLGSPTASVTLAQGWMVFQCLVRPWLQKVLALALAANSFMLVWSEATIGSGQNPDLSPFSHMIGHGAHGEVATQLLTALPLAYMCVASYYSLFKLVIFSYYQMVPHATDPVSLLLNAGQVCRFAAPLAYNFMHVIRMNEGTVFAIKMGTAMDIVKLPMFGADFNTWFPLTVVIYCLLLYLNIWDAVVGICLPKRFRFDEERGDDEHTERGRQLLRQEQNAKSLGLPAGECLGLWGTAEAPGISSAAQERLTARKAGRGAPSELQSVLPKPHSSARSPLTGFQVELPSASHTRSWQQQAQPVPEAGTPITLSSAKPSSQRGSHSGGKSAHAKTSSSTHLDDIFASFEPGESGAEGLGRIDDDDDQPQIQNANLLRKEGPMHDSPRSAWNRVWR